MTTTLEKTNENNTSSSDYDDEINDTVGDFNANIRKFSKAFKQNFYAENEIKRKDYEPFDNERRNNIHKNNFEKLKTKTRKIPESLRRASFR